MVLRVWKEVEDVTYFNISKAFHIIRGDILTNQGNKSTMMRQQSWLKRHTQKSCQELAGKKVAFI